MNNCKIFTPVSIAEADGTTTITLERGVLQDLCDNQIFGINLGVSNPVVSTCNKIIITDSKSDKDVFKNNQYFRPANLPCGCNMILCNKKDPETIAVFCRFSQKQGCR